MIEDSAIFDIEASVRNITETERIVIDRHIVLNGIKFDAQDIYDTLVETCSSGSDCYMTDEKMIDALKKLRIIEHGGCNRWMMSAAKGENYKYFMEMLETKLFGD